MSHTVWLKCMFALLFYFIPNTSKNMEVWKWRGWLILEWHRWAKCLGALLQLRSYKQHKEEVDVTYKITLYQKWLAALKSQQSVALHFHHLTHSYNKSLKRNYGCVYSPGLFSGPTTTNSHAWRKGNNSNNRNNKKIKQHYIMGGTLLTF